MRDEFNPGVPLGSYRTLGAGVLLTCVACQQGRTFDLEVIIERLAARGVGGEHTGIKEGARHVRATCPRCGGRRFDSKPDFPPNRKDTG
jgi:hypothetical protein